MSAEHVKYMPFDNEITKYIYQWFVTGEIKEGPLNGFMVKDNAWDCSSQIWDDDYEPDEPAFMMDLLHDFAGNLSTGLERYIMDEIPGELFDSEEMLGSLVRAGYHAINFPQVAEAVMKHDDEWDQYIAEKQRRENGMHLMDEELEEMDAAKPE